MSTPDVIIQSHIHRTLIGAFTSLYVKLHDWQKHANVEGCSFSLSGSTAQKRLLVDAQNRQTSS